MIKEEIRVKCYDDFYLDVSVYGDYRKNFKGVVQISHGKGEHSGNYTKLIEKLLKEGYIVCIHDHRGHGKYNKGNDIFNVNTEDNNFSLMVKDLKTINSFIRWKFKGSSVYLIGHSMGAYLSLKYSEVYGDSIDGLILSGIGKGSNFNLNMPVAVTKFICSFKDASKPSKFVSESVFKKLNDKFKEDGVIKDRYSFTTSNQDVIDRYNRDDLRIKEYTLKFYHDLFCGIRNTLRDKSLKGIPKNLKIMIVAGSLDPVCSFEKGVKKLNEILLKNGISCFYKIYENMRHEVFVENNNEEVFNDILEFLKNIN